MIPLRLLVVPLIASAIASAAPAREPYLLVSSRKPADAGGLAVTRYGVTRRDYQQLAQIPAVIRAAPLRSILVAARRGDREVQTRLTGCTPQLPAVAGIIGRLVAVQRGRFLTDSDLMRRNSVAVLEQSVSRKLFGAEDPIGQNVRVGDQLFLVVGIVKGADSDSEEAAEDPGDGQRQAGALGEVPADSLLAGMYIPLSTMRARMGDTHVRRSAGVLEAERMELSHVWLALDRASSLPAVRDAVQRLLEQTHETSDYSIHFVRP